MNATRRKTINEIADRLESIKVDLESLLEEEQGYLDNMPESIQGGEKGTQTEEHIGNMEQSISDIESAIDSLGNF